MAPPLKRSVLIILAFFLTLVPEKAEGNGPVLRRQKREWLTAPKNLKENHDYTKDIIARIRSDKENHTKITYYLSGPGVDEDPVDVFGVDRNTGFVKLYSLLDREKVDFYRLKGMAKYADGTLAEKIVYLNITVLDENDCAPVIKTQQVGFVNESSKAGTVVMKVIATDGDQENTVNSMIQYSIVQQSSTAGMFRIDSRTGEILVLQNTLDREKQDTYKLMIKASDLNGEAGGMTSTGEVVVKILDINDNVPTLEKQSYDGYVEENTINVEVMRLKAVDLDLSHTDNWLAVYEITSGNEHGYFSITTDTETNEGIIMIKKALNYEEIKVVDLAVAVSNKAQYNFGSGSIPKELVKSYPVKISVVNQMEGPRFEPGVKVVSVSEDHTSINFNKIIANYAAIDTDTLRTVTNVRYAKLRDDDNWLIIDEKTADIRLKKLPDRESKFVVNGTYRAEIICITNEKPQKTATGTIEIRVEDFNDHCPILTTTTQTMCHWEKFIYVTAIDQDEFPNSGPFKFTVIQDSSNGNWKAEPHNETTVILRDQANLWPGTYKVAVEVTDQQGKSCGDVQMMDVIVCTCNENTKSCKARSATTKSLGASGVLLLLLGLLLLLLLPLLLLFCLCGGAADIGNFKPIPFDTKQQLISYHTEGQGEDKDIPHPAVKIEDVKINAKDINSYEQKVYPGGLFEVDAGAGKGSFGAGIRTEDMYHYNRYERSRMEMDLRGSEMLTGQEHLYSRYSAGVFDGMALSDQFLGEYYSTKSNHAAQQSEQKDALLVYDYEGQESLAGSVGCCSLLENDDDLSFLNDLGPKFRTLAEICKRSSLVTESVDAGASISPPKLVSPIRPSVSTHTQVNTHSETIRDRDHININTINTSNVMPESSTIVKEERITERFQGAATLPKVNVQDKIAIPSQTLLLQQPTMYYATTPMYVVEPKPQVMLVAGAAQQAVGQVGLSQGLVQVGGLQGSQGVVLVDRQIGGLTGGGLSQGTVSMSRQVLVENGSSGGGQVVHLAKGFVPTQHGSTVQGVEVRSQGQQVKTQSFSLGSRVAADLNENFPLLATPELQGSQKVVVQRKKVSVTERNLESGTRA